MVFLPKFKTTCCCCFLVNSARFATVGDILYKKMVRLNTKNLNSEY